MFSKETPSAAQARFNSSKEGAKALGDAGTFSPGKTRPLALSLFFNHDQPPIVSQ